MRLNPLAGMSVPVRIVDLRHLLVLLPAIEQVVGSVDDPFHVRTD
jgi:hypothetical protein